jgi:acetyltransferase-like isoleucine patch superfamily enzyme
MIFKFNRFMNGIDNLYWSSISVIYSAVMYLIVYLKEIPIGQNCIFFGLMKFKHSRNSTIKIGSKCVFRSKPASNLIGVNRPCIFTSLGNGSTLTIGDRCGFSGTVIGCFDKITIGNDVRCGANTLITDSDWHLDDPRAGNPSPVVISDNVWLGVNVTILKGVTIGTNSVIGANSVVVKDIPAGVIAVGNPCKVVKLITD